MKKVNVRIYQEDWDVLKSYYPSAGYNQIVRTLVNRHARALQAKTAEILQESELNV